MENLMTALTELIIQIVVLLVGTATIYVSKKAIPFIEAKKQKDTLGIIEMISWKVVEYVEDEFKGEAGKEKQSQAVRAVKKILNDKGISITEEEIRDRKSVV